MNRIFFRLNRLTIYFYTVNEPYGELSNFSKYPFTLGGKYWLTSEHYFQAQKFQGTPREEEIRRARSARAAAELGRSRSVPIRVDWEEVKDDVMRTALKAKFSAYPELQALLLSTGEEELVERTTDDYYWGCGTDGTGKNMLGKILMEIRKELRSASR